MTSSRPDRLMPIPSDLDIASPRLINRRAVLSASPGQGPRLRRFSAVRSSPERSSQATGPPMTGGASAAGAWDLRRCLRRLLKTCPSRRLFPLLPFITRPGCLGVGTTGSLRGSAQDAAGRLFLQAWLDAKNLYLASNIIRLSAAGTVVTRHFPQQETDCQGTPLVPPPPRE